MARTRGKSKAANWRRPEQVAVIVLDLDLSGDPVLRRRVELPLVGPTSINLSESQRQIALAGQTIRSS